MDSTRCAFRSPSYTSTGFIRVIEVSLKSGISSKSATLTNARFQNFGHYDLLAREARS